MSPRPKLATLEEYLGSVPAEVRAILEEIRRIVERAVPEARPTLSYQMPAFKTDRVFIYFAGFRKHIGIFPPVGGGDEGLDTALRPYRGEKGNLRFPLDQPMPYDLIRRVVEALARQASRRSAQVRRRRGENGWTYSPDKEGSMAMAEGSDAGTKGTGSAGMAGEGGDAGTKGTGSAGMAGEGGDAGTKGTGSAGMAGEGGDAGTKGTGSAG